MNFLLILQLIAALHSGQSITYSKSNAHEIIYAYEVAYGIPYDELYITLNCESGLNPSAFNAQDSHGGSEGIAQINIGSHPFITKKQRRDALWSINWAAQQFAAGKQGMWSCYVKHAEAEPDV